MSKLSIFLFLLMVLPAYATAATSSENQNTKKTKYIKFDFSPEMSGEYYKASTHGHYRYGTLASETAERIKYQLGGMETSDFNIFGLVGLTHLGEQGDFIRMGLLAEDQDLDRLNAERVKLKLSAVDVVRSGDSRIGRMQVFGVIKNGRLVLPLERKALPIENNWGTSNYLMDSPIPNFDYFMDVPIPNVHDAHDRCSIKSYLFANDLNLDAHPELFSFEGWRLGYMPEYGMIGAVEYITLHVNDGQTGKEVFAVKLAERNPFGLDPETQESKAPYYQNQAKLYFADFDENDRLDILVWQRNYNSNNPLGPDAALRNPADWKLASENFKRFEESPEGYKEAPVTIEQAKRWMKERGLTWRKGFPDKRACSAGAKTEPFTFFSDPVLHE